MRNAFRSPSGSDLSKRRRGTSTAGVLAAVGFFGVVLATLFFVADRPHSPQADVAATNSAVQNDTQAADDEESQTLPRAERDVTVDHKPAKDRSAAPEATTDSVARVPSKQEAGREADARHTETKPVSRVAKVKAQLAAGEFGPAFETAMSAETAREKTRLLQMIAEAQTKAGEFDGALAAIRRIPDPERRRQAREERAQKQSLAGGSGADFDSLMELIRNSTAPPAEWQETDGLGGSMREYETGVRVDPNGMLHRLTRAEQTKRLEALGIRARKADLNDDMAQPSRLRLVSLTRLEDAVAERLANGKSATTSMKHLAGLSRIRHVFVYPEEGEIVIGGPAEGWEYNEQGLPVGVDSGRPTLQLDDLVTVFRTFAPEGMGMFNCLIVPRREGLRRAKEYAGMFTRRRGLTPGSVKHFTEQLEKKLGPQDVRINGVPLDSRVARVILEADYRMKMIGIGKMDGGPEIPSYFDLARHDSQSSAGALDALRWWLTMKYDAVLHSEDRDVFEIRGSSVLCRSENEKITAEGERIHTGQASLANRLFAQHFTEHYEQLARNDLIFADLQNIFDLALVAALVQHERLDRRVGWDRGVFAASGTYRPESFPLPKTVHSVANYRVYGGREIVVQVAGGVRADLLSVVRNDHVYRTVERLKNLADKGRASDLPEDRWWWDAAR